MTDLSVVILNYNTRNHLEQYLPSVLNYSKGYTIVVVDNGSTDGSAEYIASNFPEIRLITLEENLGYTGGYNTALKQVVSKYWVLLNSDVEVTEGWLEAPLHLLEEDENLSAVQPKILSYSNKDEFEYAGAAGGHIDWLGYPFCRGRIFETLEKDQGQYDDTTEIFWASGACLFMRAADFELEGGFDEDFFAHMEEIDLCWRLRNRGKKIMYTGLSTVYHLGGGTLSKSSPRKTFYNFRNGLEMMTKNLPLGRLIYSLPIRLILDMVAFLKFTIADSPKDGWAVIKALFTFIGRLGKISKKRSKSKLGVRSIYPHSIVLAYFLKGKKKFSQLRK